MVRNVTVKKNFCLSELRQRHVLSWSGLVVWLYCFILSYLAIVLFDLVLPPIVCKMSFCNIGLINYRIHMTVYLSSMPT